MSAGEGSGPGGGLHGMPAGLLFGMTQPGGGLPPMMNPPPGLPPGLPPPGLPPPGLPPDFDFSALAQLQGLPPGGLSGLPGGLPGLGGFGGLPGLPGGLPGDPGSNPMLQALLAQAPAGPSAADTAALMAQAQQQQPPQQQQQQAQQQAQRAEEERREQRRRGEAASAQAEMREKLAAAERVKCHLHKKPKAGCKFCAKHQDAMEAAQKKPEPAKPERRRGRRIDRAISEDRDDRRGPLELANPKTFGLSGLLQTHIVECAHYKSLLTLDTFDQVTDETFQFATAVEPYMANSGTVPSALFCCLYRFFTLGLDRSRLQKLMDSQESPFIRCAGFLYVRFGLPHDQLLGWLGDYILDDEEFKPSAETDQRLTIGEFVEALLSQDRYYNTVLPRLPMVTKRAVEERLAPLGQNRKRMQANKSIIDKFRDRGCRVEANIDGEWMPGAVVELDEERPNRPTVRVRLDDGGEEYVLLGKVILSSRGGGRERSRSPPRA
ncbi:unnamed protein product, partial [Prorocentrum cordatum]